MNRYTLASLLMTAGMTLITLTGCRQRETEPAPTPPPTTTAAPAKPETSLPSVPSPATPATPAVNPTEPPPPQTITEHVEEATKVVTDEFTALLDAFQSATPKTLEMAQDAVEAARSGDYGAALTLMQRLLGQADSLTAEQQDLLKQAIDRIQGYVKEKLATDPAKAVNDLQKSLPFGR